MGSFFSSETTQAPGSQGSDSPGEGSKAPGYVSNMFNSFKKSATEKYNSVKSLTTNIWDKSPEQIQKMIEKGNTEMGFPNERIFLALCMLLKVNTNGPNGLSEFKNILFEYSKDPSIKKGDVEIDKFVQHAIQEANKKECEKLSDETAKQEFIETKKKNFIEDIKTHDPNKTKGGSRKTRRSKKSKTGKKKRTPKKK